MSKLTQAIVKEVLHYDPETGAFTWRLRDRNWFKTDRARNVWNAVNAGKSAGWLAGKGYLKVTIFGRHHRIHRLVWLYQTGEWPIDQVDHINRDRTDNRWANLRLATNTENARNAKIRVDNTTGFKGVVREGKKWAAQISVDGQRMHLGIFMTPEGASLAYRWAAERYHREFAS